MTSRRIANPLLAVGFGLALSLVACGGTAQPTSGNTVPSAPDLTIYAKDNKFDQTAYTAKAGTVNVAYLSQGNTSHNLIIQDSAGNKVGTKLILGPGSKAGEAFVLTAGTYKMFCDVPGHKQSMNATLTVS
jgi:plastocyanin